MKLRRIFSEWRERRRVKREHKARPAIRRLTVPMPLASPKLPRVKKKLSYHPMVRNGRPMRRLDRRKK